VSEALLRGREHTALRAVELIAEGRVAIALSIGGAPKRYDHTDPNEDAAAFVRGSSGDVLAVADAHYGFEAAEVLLENLLSTPAVHWAEGGSAPEVSWRRHAIAALCDANTEILRERRDDASASATTLSLAVIRPDTGWLLYACVGDSHLFAVAGGTATEVAPSEQRRGFLGDREETPETLETLCRIGALPLEDPRRLSIPLRSGRQATTSPWPAGSGSSATPLLAEEAGRVGRSVDESRGPWPKHA
jgi:hypothetical protein